MARLVLFSLFLFPSFFCYAQQEPPLPVLDTVPRWRADGSIRLNFSQVHLVNWVAGGQSSVSAASFFDGITNYKNLKHQWESRVELGYGFLYSRTDGYNKTDDKIALFSEYSYKAYRNFNYMFLTNFRTQFAPGFNFPNREVKISDFFSPAFLITSLGMNYKRDKRLTLNLSPIASRFTFVADPVLSAAGAFGLEPGRIARSEIGSYFRGMYRREDVWEGVTLQVNLDLFSNYLEKPENIDVNFEGLIILKVNKYLSANISTHLIYDDDIKIPVDTTGDGEADSFGPRVQFKEVLSIGFSFKF
jgi:hypothetical protein